MSRKIITVSDLLYFMNLQYIKLNLTTYSTSLQLNVLHTSIINYTFYKYTLNYPESIQVTTVY